MTNQQTLIEEVPEAPDVPAEVPPALERLGPSPFPRSGFPFLGFLATVYDHVASHVGSARGASDADAAAAAAADNSAGT
jgi:hypothetical protein